MLNENVNPHMLTGLCVLFVACLSALAAADAPAKASSTPDLTRYFHMRNDLTNFRLRVASGQTVRVVFLGGSITEHGKWPGLVEKDLTRRFPKAKFDFVNAGISSYDSTSDAFRIERDVTSHGQVDLLFVDCAVNDATNGRTQAERIRAMEGIVRKLRRLNPYAAAIMLHFVEPPFMNDYNAGKTPAVIASFEKVAEAYGVSTIDLAHEVADDIKAGKYDWKKFGGVHPAPFGNEIYAATIAASFEAACAKPIPADAKLTRRPMPNKPLDALNYENGRLLKLEDAKIISGWKILPNPGVPTRPRHKNVPFLVASEAGAELTLKFTGRAVGYVGVIGPDCGMLEYRIDDGPWKTRDPFTRWSRRQHLGWTVVLESDLPAGEHVLTLKTSDKKNPASKGNACRIRRFLAN